LNKSKSNPFAERPANALVTRDLACRNRNANAKAAHRDFEELTQRNIQSIAELERVAQAERTKMDRITDGIAGFCGSIASVWVHIAWFGGWIVLNSFPGVKHIDPFPFAFLTFVTSLEAIFLTTFVLISQNRQGLIAERRNHLDLQINMISEQENSKMLQMLDEIRQSLGVSRADPEVNALQEQTRPEQMAQQIKETIEESSETAETTAK
jgi:uncharacterized membrane protein